jgi:hypothetical protein
MGKHYVPQKYLQSFCTPSADQKVWMFDKKTRAWSLAAIKRVAQEPGYFSPRTETELNEAVEGPANRVLDKLRKGAILTRNERTTLGLYIGVMMMRVPRKRRKGYALVPGVLQSTIRELREQLTILAKKRNDPHALANRLAELDQLQQKFAREPPKEVVNQILNPWPSEHVLAAICGMTWRFISTEGPSFFLTTDNPAFFFEGLGIANPTSELTFPLSPNLALVASWQGKPEATLFFKAKHALVKEINRRLASGAERFLFYRERVQWIETLATREKPYLSRIVW